MLTNFLRALFFAYLIFLTALLLCREPSDLIAVEMGLLRALLSVAHLLSFAVLAVLALAPRWPLPRWVVIMALAAYGGATELLQTFVWGRTPDWVDWFQDLIGIAIGTALWWSAATAWDHWSQRQGPNRSHTSQGPQRP